MVILVVMNCNDDDVDEQLLAKRKQSYITVHIF